jgi:hypothetical protein
MGDLIRIVDSISATPSVLFDLNDENPCGVRAFSAPPPQLVRANVQTMLQDGATDAGSVYGDRFIEVDLELYAATQDASATVLQNLGRLLSDPRGQWLMYQPTGATAPVFFRLKRADISAIEDVLASSSMRNLELSFPAEPFAYGLPVTDTITIANDPTAASNPMRYVMPPVQGDVTTPLMVSLATPRAASTTERVVFATAAVPASLGATLPVYVDASAGTVPGASTGWTISDVADAAFIAGKKRRLVRASGVTEANVLAIAPSVSMPFGEYRFLIRGVFGVDTGVRMSGSSSVVTVPATATARWHDVGVVRLPWRSSLWDAKTGLSTALQASLGFSIIMNAAGTADIDGVAFVPVGLDQAIESRWMSADFLADVPTTSTWSLDGINEVVNHFRGGGVASRPAASGGFPVVTPNAANYLFFANVHKPDTTRNNVVANSESFTYLYFPRYLYVRPAAS